MRALVGKKWYPKSWNGYVWEDLDKAVDMESLNSDEPSLPVEAAFSSLSGRIKPALIKKTVETFHVILSIW